MADLAERRCVSEHFVATPTAFRPCRRLLMESSNEAFIFIGLRKRAPVNSIAYLWK